jgi:hypothetical protein
MAATAANAEFEPEYVCINQPRDDRALFITPPVLLVGGLHRRRRHGVDNYWQMDPDASDSATVPIGVYVRFARFACHRTGLAESSREDTAELR